MTDREAVDFLKKAQNDPEKPYFLCFDRVNLSRAEYYLRALNRFGLKADECFFVDDVPANVEGALIDAEDDGSRGVFFHSMNPEATSVLKKIGADIWSIGNNHTMDAGRDVILEIEMQGARQVCAKRPETIRIFIAPPSWKELERRLVTRGTDAPEKIAQRLRQARVELENAGEYDYMVVNETVEKAAEEVAAIICAEHCRVDDRLETILKK